MTKCRHKLTKEMGKDEILQKERERDGRDKNQ